MSRITLGQGTLHQYTPSGIDIEASVSLQGLSDIKITSLQNGQIIKYDSSIGKWINAADGTTTSLAALTDVVISGVSGGQALIYNSGNSRWENTDITVTTVDGGTY